MSNQVVTGKDLIALGFKPERWFADAIKMANSGVNMSLFEIAKICMPPAPLPLSETKPYFLNIEGKTDYELANIEAVKSNMNEIMKLPTVKGGAVMPDACPSDPRLGYIPVGAVVSTENAIHPSMHSADVCCSMAGSFFEGCEPSAVLDAAMSITHFGWGARNEIWQPPINIMGKILSNRFLKNYADIAVSHFGTQGDGNHFFYVGRRYSDGAISIVTHHGSRGLGARLYKEGMVLATKLRNKICPEAAEFNGWIVADSREGQEYWEALQIVREWTRESHFAIHMAVSEKLGLKCVDRFWNEHNFVFQRTDGLFYHAKGATPAYAGFSEDDCGRTMIPLNMAEPVLVCSGLDAANGLGFSPHGAGRNIGRRQHMKLKEGRSINDLILEETKGLDIRFYSGKPDISELPSAYKSSKDVKEQMDVYSLARVVDTIEPYGCIMAGDQRQ